MIVILSTDQYHLKNTLRLSTQNDGVYFSGNEYQKRDFGLLHAINKSWKDLRFVIGTQSVFETDACKTKLSLFGKRGLVCLQSEWESVYHTSREC